MTTHPKKLEAWGPHASDGHGGPTPRHDPALRLTMAEALATVAAIADTAPYGGTDRLRRISSVARAALAAQPAPAPSPGLTEALRAEHPDDPDKPGPYWDGWHAALDAVDAQPAPAPSPKLLARATEAAGIRWSVSDERQYAIAATIAAEYARLANKGEPCAAHVHGHASCSLPTGHEGDHAAWVTDQ